LALFGLWGTARWRLGRRKVDCGLLSLLCHGLGIGTLQHWHVKMPASKGFCVSCVTMSHHRQDFFGNWKAEKGGGGTK
jgi:hypothetical protein